MNTLNNISHEIEQIFIGIFKKVISFHDLVIMQVFYVISISLAGMLNPINDH